MNLIMLTKRVIEVMYPMIQRRCPWLRGGRSGAEGHEHTGTMHNKELIPIWARTLRKSEATYQGHFQMHKLPTADKQSLEGT